MTTTRFILLMALGTTLLAPPTWAASNAEETRTLIATLQAPDASLHDKGVACRRLAVVGTPEAVPVLAALLADEQLSHLARFALEPMPDPAAGAALRDAMGKLHGPLLVGVIDSLGLRRDTQAEAALTAKLADPDGSIAAAAAAALGRIGNTSAAQALEHAFTGGSTASRPALADASLVCAERLTGQGDRREATALYDTLRHAELPGGLRMAAMRGAILVRQAAGVPLLLEQLEGQDVPMTAVALRVARELPGTQVTEALAGELGKLPEPKRVQLLQALRDRGDPAALPVVLESAKSGAANVRVAALRAVGRLGNASAVPVLLEAAAQSDAEVAQAAQVALGTLPGQEVDAALVSNLSRGAAQVRHAAIEAVAQRQVAAAVPELRVAAADPDPTIRLAAIKALGETAGAADFGALTKVLVGARGPEDLSAAEAALAATAARATDKPACAGELAAAWSNASPAAQCALLRILGQVGGPQALQAVRAAGRDANAQVKDTAIRTLADWPEAAAAPDLLQIIRTTDDPAHRVLAFRGYVRLAGEAEVPAGQKLKMMTEAFGLAATAPDKKLVLSGLGEIGTVESLHLAAQQLSDPELANEAGAAVVKISAQLGTGHKAEVAPALSQVLQSAKAKPVLDAARRQMRQFGLPAQ